MTQRLLLADSHWIIRAGLRAVVEANKAYNVIGECARAQETVISALDAQPDIVLMDFHLPDEGGITAARRIKERKPRIKIVMLCDHAAESQVREALRAGCDGFARKNESERELLEALHSVACGNTYIDTNLMRQLVLSDYQRNVQKISGPLENLSEREIEVFRLIGAGHTNRAAGEQLALSPKTVEKHRAAVMTKLGLRNVVELRMLALELGMLNRRSAPAD